MEFCITNKTISPKLTQIKEAVCFIFNLHSHLFREDNREERAKAAEGMLWSYTYVLYTTPEHMKDVGPTHADVFDSMRSAKHWHTVHLFFNNYLSPLL